MVDITVTQIAVRRRLFYLFMFVVVATVALVCRLAWIQIVKSDWYYQLAWEQWNRSIPTRSPRGSIYDRHGRLLAGSTTVETVVAIPARVEDAERTARLLAPVLEMEESKILELLTAPRSAIYVKRQVEPEVSQKVRDLDLPGITFTTEGKRFYPNGTLASQILGFVGTDQGWGGLEIQYEEQLKGREGRLLFPSDAWGRQLPHEVRRYVPPKEGMNLHLTIDETIQYIMERELARAMLEWDPKQILSIAVDPRTGAVLAAASKPDFDPARYADYPPENWALGPVTRTIEPGSTFKLVTLSAAIEEGLYNENEYFHCTGHANVAGVQIGCWTASIGGAHGSISYLQAVEGSCNPAFINLGQRLGKEKLFSYIRAFGFGEQTGLDYPGEGTGIIFEDDQIGPVELATSSFGQGVSVTPLQLIMTVAAIANGGYLMQPYLVAEIRDVDGNLVYEHQPVVRRQVISRETAEHVTRIMESVVIRGSGMNAAIEGYRVAGKTGTAQKVGPGGGYSTSEYILSLVGFVPADDPQIVLYVAVDAARRGPQWGSQICAPIFKRIMNDVISYLHIPPSEADEDLQPPSLVEVPDLKDLTPDEAAGRLDSAGLLLRVVGEGPRIINQTPKAGVKVPLQTQVVVYLGDSGTPGSGSVAVPDLQGFTVREAGEVLQWMGLRIIAEGSGVAVEQRPAAGTPVEKGAAVEVFFRSPLEAR